ncbi:MAG TPA: ABC transporter ATP-binding protein [Candidatus Saccharimonadales bacterium]|jgi:ABC-2 type transport system ATP-binding protein|nr:ABC transporter ATP-binding protein [Candidatus Saccharimonadales bacterium]
MSAHTKHADPDAAIIIENVSKTFKLPHEKTGSIKSVVVNFYRRKRTYDLQSALRNVTFQINKGEFFGIVGRNGSGKSTLLKMLAGIYTPTKGSIAVNGTLTPFIELGVGFNPELTGRENVFLNGALLGFSRKEMDKMYKDIVSFAELEKFMEQKLKNYSSGMQVRLAFSIAIRARTDILLLDEVLAVGDAAFQQKCFNYFEELREQKKTVVFVSHDMDAVRRFCTSAVYIKDGNLIHKGSPLEIADIYLEENMESSRQAEAKQQGRDLPKKNSLSAKIANPEEETVAIRFTYKTEETDEMYLGISIIKDGMSLAELNTSKGKLLNGSGHATYHLDTRILNGGVYSIGAGLFRAKNAELLSINTNKAQFIVKGSDSTRGGALKLADTWEYE